MYRPAVTDITLTQVLKLSHNSDIFISSRLQPQSFLHFKALQHLDLSDCGISGPFLPSLAAAVALQHLNLSSNPKLSGPLPELWAGLTKLQELDVSGCAVTGRLPESWAAMQQLRVLRAADNKPGVSGRLPESWGMLESLEVLDVSKARLIGSLPAVWADPAAMAARAASMLMTARRRAAQLVKPIPGLSSLQMQQLVKAASDAEIVTLQRAVDARGSRKLGMMKLQQLRLSGNRLTGQLPKAYSAMGDLREVVLDGNRLTGQLPVDWAALKELQVCRVCKLVGSTSPLWRCYYSLWHSEP